MRHGSMLDPPNRFETLHFEFQADDLEWDQEYLAARNQRPVQYMDDDSKSIVSENQSPDIPFRYSVNPYRGCVHGCAYCYARNWHEYLGFNAGLDFETKIIVKRNAPTLFRQFLDRPQWNSEAITFSGITDCYQPAERIFKLTKGCLEVAAEFFQAVSIVTKNALVVRDRDLLGSLAAANLVHVNVSITTLDPELARDMEPRTSTPVARLRAIRELTSAGIPVRVLVAPVIPGLNDSEIPEILKQARLAGATDARYIMLRLPLSVEPVFREWLERTKASAATKIAGRVKEVRGGKMNESEWGQRMTGTGPMAEQIRDLFGVFRRKLGFTELPPTDGSQFRRPGRAKTRQLDLFE